MGSINKIVLGEHGMTDEERKYQRLARRSRWNDILKGTTCVLTILLFVLLAVAANV